MYTRALISLAGSIVITAGIVVGLSTYSAHGTPTTIDGLPVITLPAVRVTASVPAAPSSTTGKRSVALTNAQHPLSWLVDSAATQVSHSHLGMPYYSFGSGLGQAGKD